MGENYYERNTLTKKISPGTNSNPPLRVYIEESADPVSAANEVASAAVESEERKSAKTPPTPAGGVFCGEPFSVPAARSVPGKQKFNKKEESRLNAE